jgi:hypothetical protein
MMKKYKIGLVFLSLVLFLMSGNVWAQQGFPEGNGEIGVGGGVWPCTLEGSLNFYGQHVDLDLRNNLGLTSSSPFYASGRYSWKKKNSLWLTYFDTTYTGTKNIPVAFTFNNTQFSAGDTLASKLHLSAMDLCYERRLFGKEKLSLDGLLTVRSLTGDVSFNALNSGLSVAKTQTVPFPLIGAAVRAELSKNLRAYVVYQWMNYNGGTTNANTSDFSAGLKYNFSPNFGISGSYRNIYMEVDTNENLGTRVDASFYGPQFMLHYNF